MVEKTYKSGTGFSTILLRTVPLFSGMGDLELGRLAAVAVRRRVDRGTVVVTAGEMTNSLFVLLSGSAKVTNSDGDGREVILSILGPREFFGEMGLLDGSPRSANVVALESCELLVLAKQDFERCLKENYDVTRELMLSLVRRLREADRKIESLALLDVYGRVERLLVEMSEQENGRAVVRRKLSKQNIAKMVGASREMVSRVMRDLETSGYIVIEDDCIVIAGIASL